MNDSTTELLDLILTQALERYVEMKPEDVEKAIKKEWPQQIGTLIRVFLHKTRCDKCNMQVRFTLLMKANGHSGYVAPICNCRSRIPFMS